MVDAGFVCRNEPKSSASWFSLGGMDWSNAEHRWDGGLIDSWIAQPPQPRPDGSSSRAGRDPSRPLPDGDLLESVQAAVGTTAQVGSPLNPRAATAEAPARVDAHRELVSGQRGSPAYWCQLESWSGSLTAPFGWRTCSSPGRASSLATAAWVKAESLSATLSAPIPAPTLLTPRDWENTNDNTPTFSLGEPPPRPTTSSSRWTTMRTSARRRSRSRSPPPPTPRPPSLPDNLYFWRVRQWRTGACSRLVTGLEVQGRHHSAGSTNLSFAA